MSNFVVGLAGRLVMAAVAERDAGRTVWTRAFLRRALAIVAVESVRELIGWC